MIRNAAPLLAAIVLIAVTVALSPAVAKEEEPDLSRSTPPSSPPAEASKAEPDVTPGQVEAVERGLTWLASQQKSDGSWGESTAANNATTSLAVLAFMAGGNTESRGRHSEAVRGGVKFLLRLVKMPGQVPPAQVGYIHLKNDEYSRMHAHGYGTLVLALAYGTGEKRRREEIKTKLELAVKLIERAQDPSGGWYYDPVPKNHEGSVTVCQIQALRAARDAGIHVDKETIRKAVRYLERSQDDVTGGFCYSLSDRDTQSYALTAAALSTLFGLGEYDKRRMIERGLDYMERYFEQSYKGRQMWFYYGNFYAAQAMWQAGASDWAAHYWREWWPKMREHLLKAERGRGYWSHPDSSGSRAFGKAYATAFATLILQVPFEILPIFQR